MPRLPPLARPVPVLLAVMTALLAAPPAHAAAPTSCGAPEPDQVVSGEFAKADEGSFVMVPFDVPAQTTAVRTWYCYDQPEATQVGSPVRHTLDLGLYGPRPAGRRLWGMGEYRGWSGSGFSKDVTVSPEGYTTAEAPEDKPVGKTTRGYRPGPIAPGTWAAELGLASIVGRDAGDSDGKVAWRVEVQFETSPDYADEPYRPAPYDPRAGKAEAGWYQGDFHVHTDQSGDANSTNVARNVFDYSFKSRDQGGAGLDFLSISDHNTDVGWGEWGRYQALHPGKVIGRSEELTTYAGHMNTPGVGELVDYRVGPVLEWRGTGGLEPLRAARPVNELLDDAHRSGGVTSINHPTIFDSDVPAFAALCRGCSWEYDDASTDYRDVDAVEVAGSIQGLHAGPLTPGPSPFTATATEFFDTAVKKAGHPLAALGGSDSHSGGDAADAAVGSPVGEPATAVFAGELTERGITEAVRAGHTYIKVFGVDGPDVRLTARPDVPGAPTSIMGDTVRAKSAAFEAKVVGDRGAGAGELTLVVLRNGVPMDTVPVSGPETTRRFTADAPASGFDAYRLQVQNGSTIEAISSPIALAPAGSAAVEPGPGPASQPTAPGSAPAGAAPGSAGAAPGPARATSRTRLRVRALLGRFTTRRGRLAVRCRAVGTDLRLCRLRVSARMGRRQVTVARGSVRMTPGVAPVRLKTTRTGRRLLRRGRVRATVTATAVDANGRTATAKRRATLRSR